MAFFPITHYDFPNVSEYDSDLREVLKISKELYDEYNTMYSRWLEVDNEFTSIKSGFNTLQNNFNSLSSKVDNLNANMDATVNSAVAKRWAQMESELNTFRTAINNWQVEIEQSQKEAIACMKAMISANMQTLTEREADFEKEQRDMLNEVEAGLILAMRTQLAAMAHRMNVLLENMREEYKRLISDVNRRIDDIIKEYPQIWNVVRGNPTDLESAVLDVYDAVRYFAYTARSFDYAQKSVGAWDDLDAPAIIRDTAGQDLIFNPILGCLNPYTDQRQPIWEVIDYVARELTGLAITADEYAECGLSAEEYRDFERPEFYAGYGIGARNFKFYSKNILMDIDTLEMRVAALEQANI